MDLGNEPGTRPLTLTQQGDYVTELYYGSGEKKLRFKVDFNTSQSFLALEGCETKDKKPCSSNQKDSSSSSRKKTSKPSQKYPIGDNYFTGWEYQDIFCD